ncbi:hypothetical protein PCASD_18319 [Puccinia coronata f. sp. avenae]|uniref:C3H1-type domain-containing protein n=1 Tax=Puccinia coronata f. sp. avenae TaxID=200324 RepID=A0A2N5S7J0_9BASI|nr:hypothetical protein PCASD_18319 [Puccinia coronata f. sp. avenae]
MQNFSSTRKTPPNTRSGHPPAIGATGNTPTISTANGNHPSTLDSSKKSASKVSHVICKFFKAGNCSAGTTCQFSHTLPELGQGKPVCQWFVKGNCRFAHKCALAHILPGQPMSMDRKTNAPLRLLPVKLQPIPLPSHPTPLFLRVHHLNLPWSLSTTIIILQLVIKPPHHR